VDCKLRPMARESIERLKTLLESTTIQGDLL
jgi:hypothetical protein